jgi:hypothetical protein
MSKTIAEKLGFKPGMKVQVQGAPDGLELGLPGGAEGPFDLLLFFLPNAAAVETAAAFADEAYRDGARLWFAYPKKSGRLATDINRDHGWGPAAARDLLPVTQIALDETWSALRFRRRHEIAKLTRRF